MKKFFGVMAITLVIAGTASAQLLNAWTFDETSGLVAADSAGTVANNGVWQASGSEGLSWGTGMIGGAAILTGENGSTRNFNVGSIELEGATQMTISMWIKADLTQSGTATGIFAGRNSVVNRETTNHTGQFWGAGWEANGDSRRFRADSTGATRSTDLYTTATTEPEWMHIVYVWDGETEVEPDQEFTAVYVNGYLDTTGKVNVDQYVSGSSWIIGGDPLAGSDRNFAGMIDDLAVWNEALDDTSVLEIYSNGLQGIGVVPEPATMAILGLGGLLARRRK